MNHLALALFATVAVAPPLVSQAVFSTFGAGGHRESMVVSPVSQLALQFTPTSTTLVDHAQAALNDFGSNTQAMAVLFADDGSGRPGAEMARSAPVALINLAQSLPDTVVFALPPTNLVAGQSYWFSIDTTVPTDLYQWHLADSSAALPTAFSERPRTGGAWGPATNPISLAFDIQGQPYKNLRECRGGGVVSVPAGQSVYQQFSVSSRVAIRGIQCTGTSGGGTFQVEIRDAPGLASGLIATGVKSPSSNVWYSFDGVVLDPGAYFLRMFSPTGQTVNHLRGGNCTPALVEQAGGGLAPLGVAVLHTLVGHEVATASVRNDAANINPLLFDSLSRPVPGGTWTTRLGPFEGSTSTGWLIGLAGPEVPVPGLGVVLLNPAILLLGPTAVTAGPATTIDFAIANDPSFCGAPFSTQGFAVTGGVVKLLNAIDVTIGY